MRHRALQRALQDKLKQIRAWLIIICVDFQLLLNNSIRFFIFNFFFDLIFLSSSFVRQLLFSLHPRKSPTRKQKLSEKQPHKNRKTQTRTMAGFTDEPMVLDIEPVPSASVLLENAKDLHDLHLSEVAQLDSLELVRLFATALVFDCCSLTHAENHRSAPATRQCSRAACAVRPKHTRCTQRQTLRVCRVC